ncbi:AAA domain-containing protein [Pseudomonas sp. zfem002]|uniref:AAA domain-containing protein n=1 Tax=Pseudomonas sp. zfem002 TaxID=3078197 RepID=UPI002927CC66|nr:AAA domain-containing protein [Pseudomonas sp. zfem002]MDU9392018.1 AAA domain-containing protein [Pseudomonas sp. zfem002]
MSNSKSKAPAENSLKYASQLAKKHDLQLSAEVQATHAACSAFIDEWKGVTEKEWRALKKELDALCDHLPGLVDSADRRKAQGSIVFARELRRRCVEEHSPTLLAALIDDMPQVPPGLLAQTLALDDPEARLRHLREQTRNRIGFARIHPDSLDSVQEKFLAYWIEGLQSTAFDALGKLENCLGKQPDFNSLGALLEALRHMPVSRLKLDDRNPPVRTLVLKLVKDGKDPVVIATLPLAALEQADKDGPGHRWELAARGAPAFNREQLGPAARIPGLLLEDVEGFDAMVRRHLAEAPESVDLQGALKLWDHAFDTLVERWPRKGGAGLEGWLAHFRTLAGQARRRPGREGQEGDNPDYVWQVARWQAVFTLVDGSAVSGASAAVCNAYRHFLDAGNDLPAPRRALFDSIATLAPGRQRSFVIDEVAADTRRIIAYFGHMDSRDEQRPGQRSAYPLDPAQRDALLGLAETGNGEVLAVNGPPGTGKTSLLRGVIASAWVQPLLMAPRGTAPQCPVIIACAATNQAVTNVISSFDETPGIGLFDAEGQRLPGSQVSVESRWLPALSSYGWYAPASLKSDGNEEKAGKPSLDNYQVIHRARPNDAWSFHGRSAGLQGFDLDLLEDAWLRCASEYLGKAHAVDKAIELLRRSVLKRIVAMGEVEKAARAWLQNVPPLYAEPAWDDGQERQLHSLDTRLSSTGLAWQRLLHSIDSLRQQAARLASISRQRDDLARVVETDAPRPPQLLEAVVLFEQARGRVVALQQANARIGQWLQRPPEAFARRVLRSLGLDSESKELQELRQSLRSWGIAVADDADLQQCQLHVVARLGSETASLQALATRVIALELPLLLADSCADLLAGAPDALPEPALLDACSVRVQSLLQAQLREQAPLEALREQIQREHSALEQRRTAWLERREAAVQAHEGLHSSLLALAIAPAKIVASVGSNLDDSPLKASLQAAEDAAGQQACQRALLKRIQDLLDTEVRSQLFHLAARYWEGRYLLQRRDEQRQARDDAAWRPSSAQQLRTLAMLAPVFVVTAFSVPKLMRSRVSAGAAGSSGYLFGEADLLIVDEAGQGSPEIGAAPFLFARRAIVVGDVEQLEPVWSISAGADGVHASHYRLDAELPASDSAGQGALQRLGESGNLMSNGSVMRMAQRASSWRDPRFEVSGLTLTNHYRCLKPIIEVCNSLVYHGALVPARKEPAPESLFRPELRRLGYLVVEEVVDSRNPGGSRRNRQEAQLIAAWIKENTQGLLRHYDPHGEKGLRLKDVVAVVTPFTGQIKEVQHAIALAFGAAHFDPKDTTQPWHEMTIDTVHSLQGAEKPVVLFSMVESSQPAEAQFYDRGSNLINVAISRARDLFITAMSQAAEHHARNLKTPLKASDYLWQASVQHGSRLNARHLVLVESANKCEVIHRALGGSIEWVVAATQGNITSLAAASSWSIAAAREPQWQEPTPVAENTLARVAQLWPGLQSLYLGTDPDAEGEQIAWQLLRLLKEKVASASLQGSPAIRRMRFHALDEAEIRRARDEAGDGLDAGLVKSALTRALLDELIAIEYPGRLAVERGEAGYAKGVGRLQLGILDLVRQHAADSPAQRVRVEIVVDEGQRLEGGLLPKGDDPAREEIPAVSADKARSYASTCQERLKDAHIRSLSIRREIRQLPAYPVLNTARVLELAWRAQKLEPALAMDGLQHLYESKVTTGDEPGQGDA